MKASDRMTKARIALILDEPFFGSLLMNLKSIEDKAVPTMCTDSIVLRWNPAFVDKLTDAEIKGVLAHEVLHCALLHPFRKGNRDLKKFNVAADYAINNHLEAYNTEAKAKTRPAPFPLPKGALINPAYKDLSAEEIYAQLPDSPSSDGNAGKQSSGNGPQSDSDGQGDGSAWGEFSEAPTQSGADKTEAEARWKVAVTQAAATAKAQGKLPGDIARMVDEILNPKLDWRELLRQFVSAVAKDDYSWTRPNPRYMNSGFILPSLRSERVGKIAVAIDTSGSIGAKELAEFLAEIRAIVFQTKPEKLVLIECDARVNQVLEFDPTDEITCENRGGGGTDHRPIWEHFEKSGENPLCVICLTDGLTTFGDEPPFPVLWAMTTDVKAPFGQTIRLEAK